MSPRQEPGYARLRFDTPRFGSASNPEGGSASLFQKIKETGKTCLFYLAEKEGFEPSRPFRSLHDFQSCALDQLGDFSI